MSIKIMSAIFETEFPEHLLEENGEKTRASTAKLVLLAIADHANDEGESAYPSLHRLAKKTGLSRRSVIDTIAALKFNGLLLISDDPSRLGTNNYNIILSAYPTLKNTDGEHGALAVVNMAHQPSEHGAPESSLTIIKPSSEEKKKILENASLDWQLAKGLSSEEIAQHNLQEQKEREVTNLFEQAMGYQPLEWWTDNKLARLRKFLLTRTPEEIKTFAAWSKREYSSLRPEKIRINPQLAIDCWLLAFPEKRDEAPRHNPADEVLNDDESKYVPPPEGLFK